MSDQQLELATLSRLQPGDIVFQGGESATFITATLHPISHYADRGLQFVVWRMQDGRWQHDCLSPVQEVGKRVVSSEQERKTQLVKAILGTPS